jgi:hypothetical protein
MTEGGTLRYDPIGHSGAEHYFRLTFPHWQLCAKITCHSVCSLLLRGEKYRFSLVLELPTSEVKHSKTRSNPGVYIPVVEALQAWRGVQFTVAVTTVAALGDLTRFDNLKDVVFIWVRYAGS